MSERFADLPAPVANHLAFMAAHRGKVLAADESLSLVGEEPEFSWWAPKSSLAGLPDKATTVRLFPFSGPSWDTRLRAAGFRRAGELSYMSAPARTWGPELPDGVTLTAVGSDEDARAFALTQAAGFAEPGDSHEETSWWREFFTRTALSNHGDPDQTFFLLRHGGEPAAVALVLRSHHMAGLYAVATRPEYRGRRYAGLLLAAAGALAHERGEPLTLQTEVGSTAERLYTAAGFTEEFRSSIHSRP
jgi:GNAT superfamily N-acetyltransferase